MKTMYRTTSWLDSITPVQVERETEHYVWIEGGVRRRKRAYSNYFDTWAEAKAHLHDEIMKRTGVLTRSLERENERFFKVMNLKEEDC